MLDLEGFETLKEYLKFCKRVDRTCDACGRVRRSERSITEYGGCVDSPRCRREAKKICKSSLT